MSSPPLAPPPQWPGSPGPFGTTELPYGVFRPAGGEARVGVAVGNQVLDLAALAVADGTDPTIFRQPSLNAFLAQGRTAWDSLRRRLQLLLANAAERGEPAPHLHRLDRVRLQLPIEVADYVDFYASEHHATNVGRIFRPGADPLTPNWKHLPLGYHGRAGTVVVSGTEVVRPHGQRLPDDGRTPVFAATEKLDFEAELGWVVGVGSAPGSTVGVDDFADHVFGVVILNDWSARDIQAWEYVPLGPMLGKSFATSISAWVLPLAALELSEVDPPPQQPELLRYLQGSAPGYAIDIEVSINGEVVSRCPYGSMYYSPAQLLAHLTVNGARLRTGDLIGSGTVSGPEPGQRGSLLELSWNGTRPLLVGGDTRTFLRDGDEVVMRARTSAGQRLGEVSGSVQPAR
jgi:fumarylacetoacetase